VIRRALDRWYAARDMAFATPPQRCPAPTCRSILRVGEVQEAHDTHTGQQVLICRDHVLDGAR
jgi:hypothetical protein